MTLLKERESEREKEGGRGKEWERDNIGEITIRINNINITWSLEINNINIIWSLSFSK